MSLQAHYTVPRGKVGFLTDWGAGASALRDVVARIMLRATTDWDSRTLMSGVFLYQDDMIHSSESSQRQFKNARRFPAMADIKISAQRTLGSPAVVEVAASFALWIENE